MHCQSNKLQSFTVWQEFGKIAWRSYSYSMGLLYEWGSMKAFLITVAEEENMSQTSLRCNRTQSSHTQLLHAWTIKMFLLFFMLGMTYQTFGQSIIPIHQCNSVFTEGGGREGGSHIAVVTQAKLFVHSLFITTLNYWCHHSWTVAWRVCKL